ncbi:hypothetical protein AVEN_211549-1 [Araneus ventricosus]|uniref:Uncharacterized protein n=1 Tax=Araneus ventricosus TaxID=182803 RepID=A0A4Y2D7Y6_ARAVE|nr:hypothetical protein AVEN_211549-1 [Araneus ventricosus]
MARNIFSPACEISSGVDEGSLHHQSWPANKSFDACSSKANKVQHLVQSAIEELSTATEIQLRKQGKRDSAAIIKELSAASPNRGTTIKKARMSFLQKPATLLPEQALVLMVDNGLSTRQYQRIREQAENLNCKMYTPYHKVKEAKQLCYPHSISVTETSAEITLQTLVDHNVSRICHIEFCY